MARPLRIEYPGAYYHVMNPGNRGEEIFVTKQDRKGFLDAAGYFLEPKSLSKQ